MYGLLVFGLMGVLGSALPGLKAGLTGMTTNRLERRAAPAATLPGVYHQILLARDAASTTGLEVDQGGTCPYRGNRDSDPTHGFAIAWSLILPDGAVLRSATVHMRLGADPYRVSAQVVRTTAVGHRVFAAAQDFEQTPVPQYGTNPDGTVSVYTPARLACADTETDMGPPIVGIAIDNHNAYTFELSGDGGGHNGTRVYWLEVTYEVL